MTLCSYGGHHWSRWFVVIPSTEVRTTPRWTITARNSYINSCSSPNCSMCCSTSAKRSIKAWSTCLAWRGGMLRFRRFRRFSPHLLLLSNGEHILLKLCLSQGCHTMKFHTLVITCHLSETIMKGSLKFIKYRYLYRWHVECRTNVLPMNFLKKNGNETGTCKKTIFVLAEMPLVCDSCDSPADDPTNQRTNQKRIKINGTPLPWSAEIGDSPPTPRPIEICQQNWTNRKELQKNKQWITDSPNHHGMLGIFAARWHPESWTILRRLSTQVRRRCAHLASRFASIQVFSRSGKVTLTSEIQSWVGKEKIAKSHGFFPNPEIPQKIVRRC